MAMSGRVDFLGQAGFRLAWGRYTLYIDPYLSDSVRRLDAPDLERQVPVPIEPAAVTDADLILITHAHIDHCDPDTLPELSKASPRAVFIGPPPVLDCLREWDIDESRLMLAEERWSSPIPDTMIRAIPAAHPVIERDAGGRPACVGFLIEGPERRRVYFAGDTAVDQEILDVLLAEEPIETAFLPVNEQNFFRARRGIIGNMSIREAFQLAAEIGAQRVFPYHWDMFAVNSAYPEEIKLIHDKMEPGFDLIEAPCKLFPEN